MENAILKDKILKLIVEDVYVTRADQISSQLKIDNDRTLYLLREMENSEHIKLERIGSKGVYVIILKSPGRKFYKSSSYVDLDKETTEDKNPADKSSKISRKTLTWIIIGILIAVILVLIAGYKQGWFS
jgi:hypothetical protein